MATETEHELYRIHRDAMGRYTYFLLTAAGAGIALAVNQTREAKIAWSQLPLAAAVGCWAFSFFCGIRHLEYVNAATYDNLGLLRVQSGQDPLAGTNLEAIGIGVRIIKEALERQGRKAALFGRCQSASLIGGAVMYVIWHVLEMYFRTVGAAS